MEDCSVLKELRWLLYQRHHQTSRRLQPNKCLAVPGSLESELCRSRANDPCSCSPAWLDRGSRGGQGLERNRGLLTSGLLVVQDNPSDDLGILEVGSSSSAQLLFEILELHGEAKHALVGAAGSPAFDCPSRFNQRALSWWCFPS